MPETHYVTMKHVEGQSRFWPHAMSRICELSWLYGGHSDPHSFRVSPNVILWALVQEKMNEMESSSTRRAIPKMLAAMRDFRGM
jgi:hypothetical protein